MKVPKASTVLIILFVAALVALVAETLIVTDLEALEAWANEAEDAVQENDESRLTELLAPDFRYGEQDRDWTVKYALRAKRDYGVMSVDVTLTDIEIQGDTATAGATIRAVMLGRFREFQTLFRFVRLDQGWALKSADPVM